MYRVTVNYDGRCVRQSLGLCQTLREAKAKFDDETRWTLALADTEKGPVLRWKAYTSRHGDPCLAHIDLLPRMEVKQAVDSMGRTFLFHFVDAPWACGPLTQAERLATIRDVHSVHSTSPSYESKPPKDVLGPLPPELTLKRGIDLAEIERTILAAERR